jgi:hypothetical protein
MTDSLHTTGTTKGSTLRARIDAREDRTDLVTGTRTPGPPSWVLDSIAERTLTGGFKTTRRNLCRACWTYRSTNGSCLCE